jgi:threonine aldolase
MIFGSDNQAGASDRVLDAITDAYRSHHDAYGADALTAAAVDALRGTFDTDLTAFFVSSGTAANMLALSTMVQPWDGVVCHHQAHILLDESTGPSLFTGGASMLPVPDRDLRLTPDRLTTMLDRLPSDGPHNVRPRALSITQANECGQVHTVDEISALTEVARERKLRVHMDGARFANAVARLGVHPGDVTWRAGVDVLCLGASKNGAVAAEAIVFFDRDLAVDVEYRLKRTGHLTSKGRLYGAQFLAWLADDHWLDLAHTANRHADRLRDELSRLDRVRISWPCESNESFVVLDRALFDRLMSNGASMYEWYPNALPAGEHLADGEVLARLVTSFATTDAHVDEFVAAVRDADAH